MKKTTPEGRDLEVAMRKLTAEVEAEGFKNVHNPEFCLNEWCVFHRPSDHHMRYWQKNIRRTGLIERMCEHGIGHPDPDSLMYFVRKGTDPDVFAVHGCDGCCHE